MSRQADVRQWFIRLGTAILLLHTISPTLLEGAPPEEKRLTIEGRVLCVDAQGSRVSCGTDPQQFALETDQGDFYLFSPKDPLANLFKDSRVRQRRFRVKVWTRNDRYVDIVKIYSIKHGQLYDIYFYCPTCNIRSYEAGDCWCCHQPYELREVPVKDE
ncbi:MAG: hypothetical protein P8020_04395 [Acidobacteriota bacterium]|jgi:hypothetical protein